MLLSRGIPLSSLKPARTNLNGPDRGAIAHLLSWSTNVGAFPRLRRGPPQGSAIRVVLFVSRRWTILRPAFMIESGGRPSYADGSGRNGLRSSVSLHLHDRP